MPDPTLRFVDRLNWDSLYKATLIAEQGNFPNSYVPIPDITMATNSNYLLVGTNNPRARPNWRLGVTVSVGLPIYASESSVFGAPSQIYYQPTKLGQLTLIHWERYNPRPYTITVSIPHWHEELRLEVWQYTGEQDISIESRLIEIQNSL